MMRRIFNTPLRLLYAGSFFFAFQTAVTSYINSSYLEQYVGNSQVGIIYGASAVFTFIALMLAPHALNRFGNYKTTLWSAMMMATCLLGLMSTNSPFLTLCLFITYLVLTTVTWYLLDIFIKKESKTVSTGETRGIYLTIINLAWVFAPLLAGIIASTTFKGVYALAAFMALPLIAIVVFQFKDFKDPAYKHPSIRKTARRLLANRDIKHIFIANLLLQIFYSIMVIYTPVYLHTVVGLSWKEIGIAFTIMLLAFVILEYPLGRLADKKWGEREMLIAGFLIMSGATALFAFTQSREVLVIALILFITRVGASIVEIMSETYFFKKVAKNDAEMISFFRNTYPFAYCVGPVCASILLLFFPTHMLFAFLSVILLYGIYASSEITDTK